jgi:hypothetical protein
VAYGGWKIAAVLFLVGNVGSANRVVADVGCASPDVREAVAPSFDDAAAALRVSRFTFRAEMSVDSAGVPQSVSLAASVPYEPLKQAVHDAALAWRFAAVSREDPPRTASIRFIFTLHERGDVVAPRPSTVFHLPCEVEVRRYYNEMPQTTGTVK